MSKKIFTVYPTALVVIFSATIRILNHLNVWLDTVDFILIVGLPVTVLIYAPSIYIYRIFLSQHDKKSMFFTLCHTVGYIVINAVIADWESLLYYMGMRELGNLIIFLPFFILSPMIVVALGFIIILCLSAFRKQR